MSDLPDYTKYFSVSPVVPPDDAGTTIISPKGGVLTKGAAETTAAYATFASHVVTTLKKFQLSKIVVSAETAAWVRFRWNGTVISAERLMDDITILIEHFPYDYYAMLGDGTKAFDIQAKYDTAAGTMNVEIVGEEV